ncbi:MAG: PAS domain-containing protein [Opitutales bacterium]
MNQLEPGTTAPAESSASAPGRAARRLALLEEAAALAQVGVWEADLRTGAMHWSRMVCEIHEVSDAYRPSFEEAVAFFRAGKDRERLQRCVQDAREHGEPYDEELHILTAKGRECRVRVRGKAEFEGGACVRLLGTLQKIEENWAHHEDLRAHNTMLLRTLAAATDFAFIATDPDGLVTVFNDGAERLLGYTAEEIVGRTTPAVFHLAEEVAVRAGELGARLGRPPGVFETFVAVARAEGSETQEWTYRRKDGSTVPVLLTITPVRDDEGMVSGFLGIARDISARRVAEQALRDSERRWQFALESAGDGIWDWDAASDKVFFSRQWKTMLGQREDEVGDSLDEWKDRVHPEDLPACLADLQAHFRGETPLYENEHRVRCKDGSWKWILDRGKVIEWNADGSPRRVIGTHTDLSQRRLAEDRLRESEERFRGAFEASGLGMALVSAQGVILEANDELGRILGHGREALLGRTVEELTHPEDLAPDQALLAEMLEGRRETYRLQKRYRHASGQTIWAQLNVSLVRDGAGQPLYFVSQIEDITETRRLQDELAAAKERLQLAVRAGGVGIWEWHIPEDRMTWDEVMFARYGLVPEEFTGSIESWEQCVHPEDREPTWRRVRQALAGEAEFHTDFRILWPDGEVRHLCARAIIVRDSDGTPRRMVGMNWDVTESVRQRERLVSVQERLEMATRAGGVGILEWDLCSGVIQWDEQLRKLYGLPWGTSQGGVESWMNCLHGRDRRRVRQHVRDALAGRGDVDTIFRIVRPDGTVRHMHGKALLERATDGTPLRMVGTNWDITEMVQQREELAALAEQAHEASAAKSAFLANMSHEIRTPMNGVLGMAGLLLDSPGLNAEQRHFTEVIQGSAEALLALINDILDLAKVESGKLRIEETGFSLRGLLREACELPAARARELGLAFTHEVDPLVPDQLLGDPGRLRQVILNLTSNALKFTAKGSVRVSVTLAPEAGSGPRLRFAVTDTGIGIAPEIQDKLFKAFSQGDASTTRRFGGTGLGLSICRELAHLMGGEVGVESRLGEGATFWFTIRLQTPASSRSGEAGSRPREDEPRFDPAARILVAEDNRINQLVIMGNLKRLGLEADVVDDGAEALEALQRTPYALVLMDVEMPRMDGLEATRRVRQGASGAALTALPIVAMTAHAHPEDRARCLGAGMNDYLSKPIERPALLAVLKRWCGPASARERLLPLPESAPPAPVRPAVFDEDALRASLMDDADFVRQLLTTARRDLPREEAGCLEAARVNDRAELLRHAHNLKGMARNLKLLRLGDFSSALERALRRLSAEAPLPALAPLEAVVGEARAEIDRWLAAHPAPVRENSPTPGG